MGGFLKKWVDEYDRHLALEMENKDLPGVEYRGPRHKRERKPDDGLHPSQFEGTWVHKEFISRGRKIIEDGHRFLGFLELWKDMLDHNPSWWTGQAAMNALQQLYPALYDDMKGGQFDPYRDEKKLPEFLGVLAYRLDGWTQNDARPDDETT